MNSFVAEGFDLFTERMDELNTLLIEAEKHEEGQTRLYFSLCRSIAVLAVSHFEGYLKDLVKNILADFNTNSCFRDANNHMKYTYCKKFILPLDTGKENIGKLKELLIVFEELNAKFQEGAFLKDNKNPKESLINGIAKNFGEENLFEKLNNSDTVYVFSNTDNENKLLRDTIKLRLFDSIKTFPYKRADSILSIDLSRPSKDKLWEDFIQNFLKERHMIAHGDMHHSSSHKAIYSAILRIEILLSSITYLLCQCANPINNP